MVSERVNKQEMNTEIAFGNLLCCYIEHKKFERKATEIMIITVFIFSIYPLTISHSHDNKNLRSLMPI